MAGGWLEDYSSDGSCTGWPGGRGRDMSQRLTGKNARKGRLELQARMGITNGYEEKEKRAISK